MLRPRPRARARRGPGPARSCATTSSRARCTSSASRRPSAALARRIAVRARRRDRPRPRRTPTSSARTPRSPSTRSSARRSTRRCGAAPLTRIEISVRATRRGRRRARRLRRRPAGAAERRARGARRAGGDAQRRASRSEVRCPRGSTIRDRGAAGRCPSLGSSDVDGNGRSGFLFFVWSPAGYTLVERSGDPPRAGTEVEDGEQRLPRDEDRAVAAAGRSRARAPTCCRLTRVDAASRRSGLSGQRPALRRACYSSGSFWTLCSVAYASTSGLIFAGVRERVVDLDERLPLVRERVLGEDRLDRALRLAGPAVDALLRVDDRGSARTRGCSRPGRRRRTSGL